MTFEAYIDGSDYVHVQKNNVWYVHRNYQLPGKWNGANEATYINGDAWYPAWNGNTSSIYSSLEPPLSTTGISNVNIVQLGGRGTITLTQLPNSSNNYEAVILLDDDPQGGPDWYKFTLNWTPSTITLSMQEKIISNVSPFDNNTQKLEFSTARIIASTTPANDELNLKFLINKASPQTNNTGLFLDSKGHITNEAKNIGNGQYEIYYRAKPEETSDKCLDNPILQDQTVTLDAQTDGVTYASTDATVKSRFNYLINYKALQGDVGNVYHNNAIAYLIKKYAITGKFTIGYYKNLKAIDAGLYAQTDLTNHITMGDRAFTSENCTVSTIIHEVTHTEQSVESRKNAAAGQQSFLTHTQQNGNRPDLDISHYTPEEIDNINDWSILEAEAWGAEDINKQNTCVDQDVDCFEQIIVEETVFSNLARRFTPPPIKGITSALGSNELSTLPNRIVKIYPNPVQTFLKIEFNGKGEIKATINIYDIAGKLLLNQSTEGNAQIDMKQLAAGTYLIKINNERGRKLYDGKVVKQ